MHPHQPAHRPHHLPSGRRGLVRRRERAVPGRQPSQGHADRWCGAGPGHHRRAARRDAAARPGPACGRAVGVVPGRPRRGGQQRPHRHPRRPAHRPRPRHRHRRHPARGPARRRHRRQAVPGPGPARRAVRSPPAPGCARRTARRRRHRPRLPAVRPRLRRRCPGLPARLPPGGGLRLRQRPPLRPAPPPPARPRCRPGSHRPAAGHHLVRAPSRRSGQPLARRPPRHRHRPAPHLSRLLLVRPPCRRPRRPGRPLGMAHRPRCRSHPLRRRLAVARTPAVDDVRSRRIGRAHRRGRTGPHRTGPYGARRDVAHGADRSPACAAVSAGRRQARSRSAGTCRRRGPVCGCGGRGGRPGGRAAGRCRRGGRRPSWGRCSPGLWR